MDIVLLVTSYFAIAILAFTFGIFYRKYRAEKMIRSAEAESKKIINTAEILAEAQRKQIIFDGKEELRKLKDEIERKNEGQRFELQKREQRLREDEKILNKKIEKKECELNKKKNQIQEKLDETELLRKNQLEMLEKISGLSANQAKEYLIENLQDELVHEKAKKILVFERELKESCEESARRILSLAIQRCEVESVSSALVSVVTLPNDEMKGRIIGREGRNIKLFENLTGVNLIVDDTPEAITLSCFDAVRREIARIALENLIIDGRIHPAKIEEFVEKAKNDVSKVMREEGQRAVIVTRVMNINPEIVKLLGRLKFRTSYGQNVLEHSIETAHLCGNIASEIGLNPVVARKCGLLHDIGKAASHEIEGSHVTIGVDMAKKYNENEVVINAIASHHGEIEPESEYAVILQIADSISASRPGARHENVEGYIQRIQKLEDLVMSFSGVSKCFAISAGREIRVIINPNDIDDDKLQVQAREIRKKIENDLTYPGQVKVHLIRETRAVDYAK